MYDAIKSKEFVIMQVSNLQKNYSFGKQDSLPCFFSLDFFPHSEKALLTSVNGAFSF